MALAISITFLIFSNQLFADVNVLIIGSTHSYSEGGESGVVHEKPFNPTAIATHLQGILSQDAAITGPVNVEFEDIYKTKAQTVNYSGSSVYNFTSRCYSLAQHYMWPDGKATRMANLRGEGTRQWDYIVLCQDPYIMANFPGMVAEGVKLIKEEVAKSANPAQVVLLAQWPESSSTFTATQFNEIVYRVGNSAGVTVVPAGKAWNSYGSKDTNANHPTPRGEYLAAAAIYSKLYNRSAKTSVYDYPSVGDAIADHALSVVQANNGVAQYTGTYTSFNPFQMKYLGKRVVNYRQTGTSTERGLYEALYRLDDVQRITFGTAGYSGVPGTRWDFNYGRGNDWWENEKDYEVNSTIHDWVFGFPMHHYSTTSAPTTMPYGIDKHYCNGYTSTEWIYNDYEDGTDLGIPYNMIRPGTREPDMPESVRAIPIRLMWQKMCEVSPGFNPLGDSTHMHPYLNDASAAFMYTLLSGRCPVVAEPTPQGSANPAWMQWLGHKIGYETAWQMSHLTTRAPGFRVLPSATAATTITPTTKETMTVEFTNPPQSNVTVNVSISNANAAIVGSNQLVFTPQNYNIPQSVSVAGIPGSAASEAFNVVYTTVSTDEIYNGLSDTWDYTITRSAPVTLTRVNKATNLVTAYQNLPVTINLNTAGATSANTVLAGPSRGTAVWSGSNVIYTPASDFVGKDGFSFATNDGSTLSVGYVEITVTTAVPNGKVSYRGNNSESGTVPIDSTTYAQNATVTVPGNTGNLFRVGYNFAGWNTAANGSGATYTAGSTFTMGASGMILYAKWLSVPTYTVTYNGNTNSGGAAPVNQIKTDGVNLTLATNSGALAKTNYTFGGWNTAADGTGINYAESATYTGNANLTLYAKWNPVTYNVTYNTNSATSGAAPANQTKSYAINLTLQSNSGNLARTGYTFAGWNTLADGLGTNYAAGATYTGNTALALFAKWTAVTSYTVSYNANGGDSGTVPADQTKQQDVTLTLATNTGVLSRTGYTFAGWNTAANGTGTPYATGASYTANTAVVLYAQWAGAATYTISYNGNGNTGGSAPSNQTKNQGVALALATNSGNLTKTGFSFSGWNTAINGGGSTYAVGATYAADAAVTLYALWNALPAVNAGSDQSVTLSASVPWSPSALGPQLWLDGSTATNNAGTVSITNAGSGGGTISGPASLAAGGIGTLQAVQFNAASKYLTGDYTNTGTTLSAFFVGKSLNATQTAYAGMMSVWTNGQANDWNNAGSSVLFNQNNATANSVQTYRNAALSSSTGTLTAGFLAGTVFDGTTNTAYLNGTAATGVASSGSFSAGKVILGARWHTSVFNYFWNGNFGEAIICNANLSTTDRQNVEGYLAHKWGLAGNLAAGHPHKTVPPGVTGAVATLDATVTDTDALTYSWSVVSGPSSVSFANSAAIDTTATFTVAGVYTLRLTANDGLGQASEDVVITVNAPGSNHTVTYNGNGSTGGTVPVDASSPYANGSTVTVLGNTGTLVRTGYTFNNWNTAANGSGSSYSPAATFSISTPTTLYAQWTINSYTITFNSAGGSAVTAITQNFGTTVTAPTSPTRSGYTFTAWSPVVPATMPSNNQTVTAQWTANTYAVTYDANSATSGAIPSAQTKTHDVSLTLQNNTGTLARTGYSFAGWNTQADGLGTNYAVAGAYTANAAVTLFAKWTANTYAVTYNANSATSGTVPTAQTKTHGVSLTLQNNSGTLARTGYAFTGWNTQADGLGTNYAVASAYTANIALILYAKWNALPVANAGTDQTVILSATPWSPAQLTTQLWLDADDTNTITLNGATVSEWRDKSGNSRHAAQITTTSQPTRTAAALNGKSVLTFDGTTDFLDLGTGLDFLAGNSHSAFIVIKPTSFNNIYGAATGNAGANSLHVGFNGTTYRMNYWTNDYLPARTANFVSGSSNIINYIWNSNTSKQILANGKSEGTNPSAGVIGTMSGGGRIGNIVGQGYIGGDIAEMVFLTGTVSTTDREAMEGYLAHKWGMAANLASNHPYKNAAPGGSGVVVTLDGTATDSDSGSLTTTWSSVSGPAAVSFANASAIDTTATFTTLGTYTLRLTVSDGVSQSTEDVIITVSEPPYTSWSGNTFTNSFTNTASTSNPDGDNLTNLQEFAFGTDPTTAVTGPLAYQIGGEVTKAGSPIAQNFAATGQAADFRAVFARRKDHVAADITYTVQFSADLKVWTLSVVSPSRQTNANSSGDIDVVSVPFPASVPLDITGTAAPKFFRVGVLEN